MKAFLLESKELLGLLRSFLKDYEEQVKDYLSFTGEDPEDLYREMLISIIEFTLMGRSAYCAHPPQDVLDHIGVSEEESYSLVSLVKDMFLSSVRHVHNDIMENGVELIYHIEPYSQDTIIIKPEPVIKVKPDPIDELRRQVKDSIDNGDYYPEKIRNLLGL